MPQISVTKVIALWNWPILHIALMLYGLTKRGEFCLKGDFTETALQLRAFI